MKRRLSHVHLKTAVKWLYEISPPTGDGSLENLKTGTNPYF